VKRLHAFVIGELMQSLFCAPDLAAILFSQLAAMPVMMTDGQVNILRRMISEPPQTFVRDQRINQDALRLEIVRTHVDLYFWVDLRPVKYPG